jgi:cytochrome c
LAAEATAALLSRRPSRFPRCCHRWQGPEDALSPPAQRGLVFVRTHCAKCHAIDRVSQSPLPAAPPFRRLHERYPVETLQESLAEGIVTGHPSMPEFQLDPGQVNDVITYLKSLEN